MIAYDHQKTNINNIAKIAPVEIQPANIVCRFATRVGDKLSA
jgi:hypothetical protein